MKENKGITLVSLVVTIIVLIILAGVSINLTLGKNGIITKAKQAKENIELAKVEEETTLNELYTQIEAEGGISGEISHDAIVKISEFKKAIADAIEEAGGVKPEYTANSTTFGDSIKGIVTEVTKNATATADNITEGKTAWVNGKLITGTGVDNNSHYNLGKEQSIPEIVGSLYNNSAVTYSLYSNVAKNRSWTSDKISLYQNPDGNQAVLNTVTIVVGGGYGAYCGSCSHAYASASTSYSIYLEDGTVIRSGSVSKNTGFNTWEARQTISFSLFDLSNINSNTGLYISGKGTSSTDCCSGTGHGSWANAECGIISVSCSYIPIN